MKAILLGSLGMLADTTVLRDRAFREAFDEHGLNFTSGTRRVLERLGRPHALPSHQKAVPIASILESRSHFFGKALADSPLRPRTGLKELIAAAAQNDVPLGLILTTPTAWLQLVFKGLDLSPEVFDTIVTPDHVTAPKPAADGYHLAAAMLATAPEDCLAVEDTLSGVAGARASGMQLLDLSLTGHSPREPLLGLSELLRERDRADTT